MKKKEVLKNLAIFGHISHHYNRVCPNCGNEDAINDSFDQDEEREFDCDECYSSYTVVADYLVTYISQPKK